MFRSSGSGMPLHLKIKMSDCCQRLFVLPEFSSVQWLSHVWLFDSMDCSMPVFPAQHQLPKLAQTHVHQVGDAIQPSHPLSSPYLPILQSFPGSGSFLMSQFFTSGGQRIGVSAPPSVLPVNIQDWFPLGLTSLISLLSKGLSRVFSNTTFQKHQFFGAQLSSQFNSPYMTTGKTIALTRRNFVGKVKCLCFWICYLGWS